jgi:hypothetical protein
MNKTVLLLVLTTAIPACFVRHEGEGYYDPPSSSQGRACAAHDQCTSGCFCDSDTHHCRTSGVCLTDSDCGGGYRCDGRSSCVPREQPADGGVVAHPSSIDASLATDAQGTPDARPALDAQATPDAQPSCDAAASNGTCAPRCHFDQQCGPGARCQVGACQRPCTNAIFCGTGTVCQEGFCQPDTHAGGQCVYSTQCGAGGSCINGFCHAGCEHDNDCPNRADVCDRNTCRPDERPLPACTGTAMCTAGQSCVDGLCRLSCGCDADCAPWGTGTLCVRGFCTSPAEVR